MSAAAFDCPGCGKHTRAAFGAIFIYEGIALKYTLCKACGNATAKKFEKILQRVELALMQPAGHA
jgi:transcription elongation factor Elf1